MSDEAFTLIQISDTHLDPADADKMQRAGRAIDAALARNPDLLVHTGDISDDGNHRPELYAQAKAVFDAAHDDWLVVPGNHDLGEPDGEQGVREAWLANWRDVFGADRFCVQRGCWCFIGINSQIVGSGLPAEADQMHWLDAQLDSAENKQQSVGVFMHQPPFINQPDEYYGDKSDYWGLHYGARPAVLERFARQRVRFVASGHTHWYRATAFDDFTSVWCPATTFIVDNAQFPAGGACFGIIQYQFTGHDWTHQLIKLDLPWRYYGHNRPKLEIPGRDTLRLDHLLLDFTGTLAKDGQLIDGVAQRLRQIAKTVRITICTADTFGTARDALADLPVQINLIETGQDKRDFLQTLGTPNVIAIGNGHNDEPWLDNAALGIAVIGPEGAAAKLARDADVVVTHINDALDLILHPTRLKATLRE